MTTKAAHSLTDWGSVLEFARRGDRVRAFEGCEAFEREAEPFPGAALFLRGRCLTELGEDLAEAIRLLEAAIEIDPRNVLTPTVLALAWLRSGDTRRAADYFREHGLPHDDDLLGQIMLTIELAGRPWPDALPEGWPPWPALLGPDPTRFSPPMDEDATTEPPPPSKLGRAERRELTALMNRLEVDFMERSPLQLAREVSAAMGAGLNSSDLHLLGGLACEEGGDGLRARAHLSLSLDLEPAQTISRTLLGRVYWRNGWNDLAEAVWRNLPVEGPDDFGRHYHLALLHEGNGDRGAAAEAMRVALHDFYVDTREIFIERVFRRWLRREGGGEPS
jgi:tetratricopeptide (TPR) repeat protein